MTSAAVHRQNKQDLTRLGFRVDTRSRYRQARRNFKRAKGLSIVSFTLGRKGVKELRESAERNRKGQPDLNRYFSFHEFQCKCGGRYASCKRIYIKRRLVVRVTKLREKVGPFTPVSAYRCKQYNASIGGASDSRHTHGDAVDLPSLWDKDRIIGMRLFTGVGIGAVTDHALHGDVRPTATVWKPITWFYSNW